MASGGKLVIKIDGDDSGFRRAEENIKKAVKALGVSVAAGMGAAIKVGMDFESQMSRVGAISSASAEDMDILTEKAKEMGETTVFSASQAGEAFEYMAMAGWKTEDMTAGIAGIMDLAAASGENLGTVSDIVTDALTAFGLSAKDSGHFADVLAAASSNANTNVSMMGETFKYAAPLAGSLGYSIEDTAVAIGLMANAGIKSTQAGTALRSTLTRLAKPPKDAQKAMSALGLSLTDTNGKVKPLKQQITEMRKAFSKLDDAQKPTYAAMIGGQEAMSGLLAIVNASEADFTKLTGAVEHANGAASEMAERNLDNLKGKLTLAGSAAEGLGIAVFEGIEEPLKKAVETGTEYLGKLTEKVKDPEFIQTTKDIGTGMVIAATAVTGYKVAVTTASAAQAVFNATLTLNPIGLAVAGITAAAVGVAAFENSINGAARAVRREREEYEENTKAALENAEIKAGQIQRAQNLAKELDGLVDANGRVKSGYEDRVSYIVGELSSATGQEIRIVDGVIQKYGDLKQSIDDVLAAKKTEALMTGVEENYKTAAQNVEEYRQKVIDLQTEHDNLAQKLEHQTEQGYKLAGVTAMQEYSKRKELEETKKSYYKYVSDVQSYEDMMAAAESKNYDEFMRLYRERGRTVTDGANTESAAAALRIKDLEAEKKAFEEFRQTAEQEGDFKLADQFGQEIQTIDGEIAEAKKIVDNGMRDIAETANARAKDIGANISAGVAVGIEQGAWRVNSASEKLINNAALKTALNTGVIKSPSHLFRDKVGLMISAGVAAGITGGTGDVEKVSADMISTALTSAKNAAEIKSPSRVFRDKVGKMISAGIAVGIDDGKTEVQKVLDDLNKDMLESEKFYLAEKERLEREKEEAEYAEKLKNAKTAAEREKIKQERIKAEEEKGQQEYLDNLKDAADRERKIYEALQKDIENEKRAIVDTFNEMVMEAADSMEELETAQTEFADKMKSYGSLYRTYEITDANDKAITGTMLADISKQNEVLQKYADNLAAIKQRGAIPKELLNQIRSMSVEEGLTYTDTLLNASDATFEKYLKDWQEKQELADRLAEETYSDDAQELADKLTEKFGKIPEDFFDIGEESAERYGEGFMEQLRSTLEQVRSEIIATMSEISPNISLGMDGLPGGTAISGSYNRNVTYNITATGGSEGSLTRAVRNMETIAKMVGGY